MKSLLDTVEHAAFVANSHAARLGPISNAMRELMSELVAIASLTGNVIASLSEGDESRDDLVEINHAARLALAKLETLGHRAPRLGVV